MTRPELERAIRHGTEGCYQYHRCRCDACRTAHAAYHRDQIAGLRVRELRPHGTTAAARRHQRQGTPLCDACARAQRLATQTANPSSNSEDPRPIRNGLPLASYAYRARTYPWALRRLAQAEAIHGRPDQEDTAA